ncbi:nucleoside 2-deoxyribosyltransferase domain-containing protein [Streptomyces sp. TLI_171]|uniref:nucleoside 2-deoxyribosyltransferase domain-containing protein n=1 Tax=Streptomyces sp. TLI_171 TaxID=1938859 RepID=UPI000C177E16|nr:nucleoside 2-deoxyribosyltransferase domain-containing protein [Streptomyces sp. TLI_171]
MTTPQHPTASTRPRYVEAPERYEPAAGDPPAIFLAGGITDCPDWQAEAAELLLADGLVVLNPRRSDFPIGDPAAAPAQIAWEYRHLHLPQVLTLFWFPAEAVQPIALLEFGAALDTPARPLAVGAHPHYPRRLDVLHQARLARPALTVRDDLPAVLADVLALAGVRPAG